MIHLKRAYEAVGKRDGRRFLVDGLWPRGVKKGDLGVQEWLKEVAPGSALRKWFAHDVLRWTDFQRRYTRELLSRPDSWKSLLEAARHGDVSLVYSARDAEHNNAVVLKEFLERQL